MNGRFLAGLLIAASADLVGRRRLLLITLFGQASFTLATAFATDYVQFVWAQVFRPEGVVHDPDLADGDREALHTSAPGRNVECDCAGEFR